LPQQAKNGLAGDPSLRSINLVRKGACGPQIIDHLGGAQPGAAVPHESTPLGRKHKVPPPYSRADEYARSLNGRRDDDA